jgi:predicted Rossmann fold nucleotide-binding protein DprA/Smf involved in DNA uptake
MRLGATPVTESAHILEVLGLEGEVTASAKPLDLSPNEQLIYEALTEPLSRDALAAKIALPVPEISMYVTLLEIRGVIKEVSGVLLRT